LLVFGEVLHYFDAVSFLSEVFGLFFRAFGLSLIVLSFESFLRQSEIDDMELVVCDVMVGAIRERNAHDFGRGAKAAGDHLSVRLHEVLVSEERWIKDIRMLDGDILEQ
jgi:hypothetical protein